jgi:Protein of unknown function (DUF4012)
VGVLVLLGMVGGAALAYSSVKSQTTQLEAQLTTHLQAGQSHLEAAKASLQSANSTHDEKLITQAKGQFALAKSEFTTAIRIADGSDLLRRLEGIPSVGQQARSRHLAVDNVAQMGIELSLAGQDLADLDDSLIKPTGTGQGGRNLLTMINEMQGKIVSVRSELESALKAADRVEVSVLPSGQQATFLHARATISAAIAGIAQFEGLVPILKEVLGGNGTRNYLIEQVNPAELRPGGGFLGTYSVLRADHGTLTLVRSGDAYDLVNPRPNLGQKGYVAPPGPVQTLIGNASWSFVDSNVFPDFPANASAGESFAQPRLGFHIDAVIAIDYYTVAKMLDVTGSIDVPGYPLTLTAANFVATVFQYDVSPETNPQGYAVHKAILSAVAGPLLKRVVTLQPSQWPALIGALNGLAASRHLQAYFNDAGVEKAIDQYGWSGAPKVAAPLDYMMEVESNLGGTKANYFVTRHYTVELTRIGATLHHQMTVDILDNMPYAYRPSEYYKAYIRLYVSDKSTASSDNLSFPHYVNPAPPAGTRAVDGWILIHGYGHNRVVVFQWDTPWQPNGRADEQIYWQKQPGTTADSVDIVWHDGNGHTYKTSGDLSVDRVINLSPSGVSLEQGQVGTAVLPSLNLG